MYDSQIIF